jgi:hypothetical protein
MRLTRCYLFLVLWGGEAMDLKEALQVAIEVIEENFDQGELDEMEGCDKRISEALVRLKEFEGTLL